MSKTIFWVIVVVLAAAAIGLYLWQRSDESGEKADVLSVVESFGRALKNVSLLSPTAAEDMEREYGGLIAPELLEKWKQDPEQAPGRLTSSPWPDRIEADAAQKISNSEYRVNGTIVEVTSADTAGGAGAATRNIELVVEKIGDRWLITGVSLGEYETGGAWKTITNGDGITYEYPEKLPTRYIFTNEWPPEVEVKIAQFLCAEPLKQINGREYCVGTHSEGAAGSVYTSYTYSTMMNERMVTVRFALQFPQCGNYDEPQKAECEAERRAFSADDLADRIARSIKM